MLVNLTAFLYLSFQTQRQEPSAEMVMLYRVFLADERASLATEKKQVKG